MGAMASQITSLTIVYSTVYSGADQRNHQSSASLAFVQGIHRWPVNSSHRWPVTRKLFSFDDVIMYCPVGNNYYRIVRETGGSASGLYILPRLSNTTMPVCVTKLWIFSWLTITHFLSIWYWSQNLPALLILEVLQHFVWSHVSFLDNKCSTTSL